MSEDRELVCRLARGDASAWDEFVRRFLRLVVHVVRATIVEKTGRAAEEDVDDVAHEVYAHLVDRNFHVFQQLREPYNLKAWIAVAARRKALDFCKRRSIRTVSLDQPAGEVASPLERLIGRDGGPAPDAEEIRVAVERSALNPKERLMVTLAFFRDQSYAEIADLMNVPENSIGPTLRRALDKVKESLRLRGRTP